MVGATLAFANGVLVLQERTTKQSVSAPEVKNFQINLFLKRPRTYSIKLAATANDS